MQDMFNFGKYDRQDKEKLLKELTEDLAKPVDTTETVVTPEPVETEPVETVETVITESVVTEPVVIPAPIQYITKADLDSVVSDFAETIKKLYESKDPENVKEKKYKY